MKILEIITAMVLVYALLSITVSLIQEWWNARIKARGELLKRSIYRMLNDSSNLNYGHLLLNHHLISSMRNNEENRPAQYLDAGIFADALIDVIGEQGDKGIPLDNSDESNNNSEKQGHDSNSTVDESESIRLFRQGVQNMNTSPFQKMLLSLLIKSDGKYENLKTSIENWFNSNMDRATGWYKRKQKKSAFWIGLLVALVLNIDSVHLFKVITMDDQLRKDINIIAEDVAERYSALDSNDIYKPIKQIEIFKSSVQNVETSNVDSTTYHMIQEWKNQLNGIAEQLKLTDSISKVYLNQTDEIMDISAQLGLPIGWSKDIAPVSWFCAKDSIQSSNYSESKLSKYMSHRNNLGDGHWYYIFLWILGIFISGWALSFGATFWFDLLVKLVNMRKAGIKPIVKPKTSK